MTKGRGADNLFVADLTVNGSNGSFYFHAKESFTTLLGASVVVFSYSCL